MKFSYPILYFWKKGILSRPLYSILAMCQMLAYKHSGVPL
jgi:hypothetical protein